MTENINQGATSEAPDPEIERLRKRMVEVAALEKLLREDWNSKADQAKGQESRPESRIMVPLTQAEMAQIKLFGDHLNARFGLAVDVERLPTDPPSEASGRPIYLGRSDLDDFLNAERTSELNRLKTLPRPSFVMGADASVQRDILFKAHQFRADRIRKAFLPKTRTPVSRSRR